MQTLINTEVFLKEFQDRLNVAMIEEAEPIIQKALKEMETRMREVLATKIVQQIEGQYSVQMQTNQIVVRIGETRPF